MKKKNDRFKEGRTTYYYYRHWLFLTTTKVTKEVFLTLGSSLLQLVFALLMVPIRVIAPNSGVLSVGP